MFEYISKLHELWLLIFPILGAAIRQYYVYRKNKKESVTLLYEMLEEMKIKVLLGIQKEINAATEIQILKNASNEERTALLTELNFLKNILEQIKSNCPDCYKKILQNVSNNN